MRQAAYALTAHLFCAALVAAVEGAMPVSTAEMWLAHIRSSVTGIGSNVTVGTQEATG